MVQIDLPILILVYLVLAMLSKTFVSGADHQDLDFHSAKEKP